MIGELDSEAAGAGCVQRPEAVADLLNRCHRHCGGAGADATFCGTGNETVIGLHVGDHEVENQETVLFLDDVPRKLDVAELCVVEYWISTGTSPTTEFVVKSSTRSTRFS